jgi:hypothetical protein
LDIDDVPVNDDFNREKRIFTIGDEEGGLRNFVVTTLDNYYAMRDEGEKEFEEYNITENAIL